MNRMSPAIVALSGTSSLLLVDSAIKGFLILLSAVVAAVLLRRDSAATRHLVWLVAIVAMLVIPVFSALLPRWQVLPVWAKMSHESPARRVPIPAAAMPRQVTAAGPADVNSVTSEFPSASGNRSEAVIVVSHPEFASSEVVPDPIETSWRWNWVKALPVFWAIGFCLLTLRLLVARWVLWKNERRGTVICLSPRANTAGSAAEAKSNTAIVATFQAACQQMGIRQRVRLLIHSERTIPVVWGNVRFRLLLPEAARNWSDEQLRSVFLHELAHIKRRDTVVQLLTQIACALHWFNPLVWFAAWRVHVERERACDDLVLSNGVRASAYAEHLLNVATKPSPDRWTSVCGLTMARNLPLHGRLQAILSDRLNRRNVSATIGAIAILLGGSITIPIAMLRASADEPAALNDEPKDARSKALFESWKTSARTDGKIPGGRIGEMAASLKTYMDLNAGTETAAQCEAVYRKCVATHDWTRAEAAALLDEIEVVAPARAEWAMRTNIERQIHPGKPLPAELRDAPWGQPAANGLRIAWLLEPQAETQPLDSVMKSRVLFHNNGNTPVCFATEDWLQTGLHTAQDADGQDIRVWAVSRMGHRTRMVFRLAPGEYAEVEGHGIGIGSHETATEKSIYKVGCWVEAKGGDAVTFRPGKVLVSFQTWQNNEGRKDSETVWNEMIAARVMQESPMPASVADRRLLLQRIWQDLFGTPPITDERIIVFENDNAPDALKRLTKTLQTHAQAMHFVGGLSGSETTFRVMAAVAQEKQKQGADAKIEPTGLLGFWKGMLNGDGVILSFHRPPADSDVLCDLYLGQATIGAPMTFSIAPDGKSVRLVSLGRREGGEEYGILTRGKSGTLQLELTGKQLMPGKVVLTREADEPSGEPRQKEPRTLFGEWKKSAYADGKIPGALIGKLATEVRKYAEANPNLDSGQQLPKLLPRFDALRSWTPAEVVSLLDDVAYYSTAPIEAVLAEPSDALWESKVRFEIIPVKIADWSPEKNGLRIGMRVAEGEWRVGGKVRIEMWLHNTSAKDVSFNASPGRADVGLSVAATDSEGGDHWADGGNALVIATPLHCTLPAGFVAKVKDFELSFDAPDKKELAWTQPKFRDLKPGDYKLRCVWSDAHSSVSGDGDWTGELSTLELAVKITAAEPDGSDHQAATEGDALPNVPKSSHRNSVSREAAAFLRICHNRKVALSVRMHSRLE